MKKILERNAKIAKELRKLNVGQKIDRRPDAEQNGNGEQIDEVEHHLNPFDGKFTTTVKSRIPDADGD
jgi:hypothetical protein